MQKQLNIVFVLLTATVFLFLLVPNIYQEGLFMDGLIYSTTGLNLANGIGTFWNLTFTKTVISNFDGHPPLAMYFQNIFFKLLGESHSVEKIYSSFTAVITVLLLIVTWNFFQKEKQTNSLYWIPILLWITIPVCFWSYQNNVLENTMGIFTLAACLCSLYAIYKTGYLKYALLFFASVFIVLGFLSKGFPAFFPLAVFGLHFIVYKKESIVQGITSTVFTLFTCAFILSLIFWDETARKFIFHYLDIQVMESLKGNQVVDPRSFILIRLLRELMAPFLLLVILFLFAFFKHKAKTLFSVYSKEQMKDSWFLFLIGLSASLPIMISPKQMGYYLLPALPFFVLAISNLIAPLMVKVCAKKTSIRFFYSSYLVFFAALISIFIYAQINSVNPTRDKDLINDVKTIGNYLEKDITIGIKESLLVKWSLIAYLQRYYFINVETFDKHKYVVTEKISPLENPNYVLVLEAKGFLLYVNQGIENKQGSFN
ncbi:MAG: glycosyltransferase family 39 protein [Bacteroidetes bacterium]|nr:glycosyltransferase family 39 protein [Bacteroidota bacterium]HET6245648.1 glycosyltransferase family 39 protein [Bacteroidia bacterium]